MKAKEKECKQSRGEKGRFQSQNITELE